MSNTAIPMNTHVLESPVADSNLTRTAQQIDDMVNMEQQPLLLRVFVNRDRNKT